MKSADQIAKEIVMGWTEIDTPNHLLGERLKADIIKALTAYAEEVARERVRKAVIDSFGPEYRKIRAEGYAQGIEEAAEEIERLQSALKDHNKAIQTSLLDKSRAEGYAQGIDDAVEVTKELRETKRKCSEANKGHDDRWCPECESMEDAYGFVEQEIRALGEKK